MIHSLGPRQLIIFWWHNFLFRWLQNSCSCVFTFRMFRRKFFNHFTKRIATAAYILCLFTFLFLIVSLASCCKACFFFILFICFATDFTIVVSLVSLVGDLFLRVNQRPRLGAFLLNLFFPTWQGSFRSLFPVQIWHRVALTENILARFLISLRISVVDQTHIIQVLATFKVRLLL